MNAFHFPFILISITAYFSGPSASGPWKDHLVFENQGTIDCFDWSLKKSSQLFSMIPGEFPYSILPTFE